MPHRSPPPTPRRSVLGRRLAQALCLVLGLIGSMPLFVGLVLRTERVKTWAQGMAAEALQSSIGLRAEYSASLSLWPLELVIHDLRVPSTDGLGPALLVDRVRIAPRFFSLVAGHLDVGEVEVERPRGRLVVRDGRLLNVEYHLPKSPPKKSKARPQPPFSLLAVTEASLDVWIDGYRLETGTVDVDVQAERGPSFELFVRSMQSQVTTRAQRSLTTVAEPIWAVEEDVICSLELRLRLERSRALVRRLFLAGNADDQPSAGTRPSCSGDSGIADVNQVVLRLTDAMVDWAGKKPRIEGQVTARAPVSLTNRFLTFLPLAGWVGLEAKAHWDGSTQLPVAKGRITGGGIQLERYRLGKTVDIGFGIDADVVRIDRAEIAFANGQTTLNRARIEPLAPGIPFAAESLDTRDMDFPGLMRDLGVSSNTIVAWSFEHAVVTELSGRLGVPELDGTIRADTHHFEVFDRSVHDPDRRHMVAIASPTVRGRIAVRHDSFQFRDTVATFGSSRVVAPLVSIGFHNALSISVAPGSEIELSDISPIANIPISGRARLGVRLDGDASDPLLLGQLSVDRYVMGGFPAGDILKSDVRFRPLRVELSNLEAKKGRSSYGFSHLSLDFDQGATIVVDGHARSRAFDVRDFLDIWGFAQDPRYQDIRGAARVDADVRYVLGGSMDRCQDGWLRVDSDLSMDRLELWGERYDGMDSRMHLVWDDQRAGFLGFSVDIADLTLRKGAGVLAGSFQVRPGAILNGQVVGTAIPLGRFDGLGALGALLDGRAGLTGSVSGTLDAPKAQVEVKVSPVRVGYAQLGASELTVRLQPTERRLNSVGTTRCGHPIPGPFDPAEYDRDRSEGTFQVDGKLFGGAVAVSDVKISRQRNKHVSGTVGIHELDWGSLVEMLPPEVRPEQRVSGTLSGKLTVEDLPMAAPSQTTGRFDLEAITARQGSIAVRLEPADGPLRLAQGNLEIPRMTGHFGMGQELSANFQLKGRLTDIGAKPALEAGLVLLPIDLAAFRGLIPRATRVNGTLKGHLELAGPLSSPRTKALLSIEQGELALEGLGPPLTSVAVTVSVRDSELRVEKGEASWGDGRLSLTGSAPLVGFDLGLLHLTLAARGVALPRDLGLTGTFDADLETTLDPRASPFRPRISGNVLFDHLEYTRPITMTADVATLTQRGKRSHVQSYDPADDHVDIDLLLKSRSPLRIHNGLVEADMLLDPNGLSLLGTNQQFGVRGTVRAVPGGRIQLRQNSFEIREGLVRFDDITRIAPRVDVRAVTEYRRYSTQANIGNGTESASDSGQAGGSVTSATGGNWRVTMHAHGDADQLRIDLTSEPALSQDDIFLLLTVGVTRTELDQAQSASVGSSVALEALGTLSGADRAVTDTIPLIDDFRFGSAYSSRTGRTEPTVTIGKRLAERIRASITSGLAEAREVRSNVEWRLNRQVSVEGSYDNVNDISSSQLGNLGADVRWRIEFR